MELFNYPFFLLLAEEFETPCSTPEEFHLQDEPNKVKAEDITITENTFHQHLYDK